jgi:hypothetical protein
MLEAGMVATTFPEVKLELLYPVMVNDPDEGKRLGHRGEMPIRYRRTVIEAENPHLHQKTPVLLFLAENKSAIAASFWL